MVNFDRVSGKLADREIAILVRWIGMGLPWPDGSPAISDRATAAAKPISEEDAGLFRTTREGISYQPADLIAHDSYLINLATPDDVLWEKSIQAFGHELDRCASLGIPGLVTHAGGHMGSGEDAGLERIAQALGVDLILSFETGGWKRVRRSVGLERP